MSLTPYEFRIGFMIKHVEDRHRWAGDLLRSAREGTLSPGWRDEVIGHADLRRRLQNPVMQRHDDVTSVVALEIANWPRRPWEPYAAGGDWRAALEAWYQDELAVQDIYEDCAREHLVTPEPTETVWWRREQRCRDLLGASYRAGLAAGGDPVDWVSWYQQRIRGREETEPARIRGRDRLAADVPELAPTALMQRLPQYWTQPAP